MPRSLRRHPDPLKCADLRQRFNVCKYLVLRRGHIFPVNSSRVARAAPETTEMALDQAAPRVLNRSMKPKILSTLPGYTAAMLRTDVLAGITVAMVALPLSIAIAIASGADPATGLTTAIIGGFLISALGGDRWKSGGRGARVSGRGHLGGRR